MLKNVVNVGNVFLNRLSKTTPIIGMKRYFGWEFLSKMLVKQRNNDSIAAHYKKTMRHKTQYI